jgi:hypothetical protein
MAKHFAKVFVAIEPETSHLIIECIECGRTEYRFPSAHVATLARVLTNAAEQSGTMVGTTEQLGMVQTSTDPADFERLRHSIDAGFDAFVQRRKAKGN